jgi:hypothetical protein
MSRPTYLSYNPGAVLSSPPCTFYQRDSWGNDPGPSWTGRSLGGSPPLVWCPLHRNGRWGTCIHVLVSWGCSWWRHLCTHTYRKFSHIECNVEVMVISKYNFLSTSICFLVKFVLRSIHNFFCPHNQGILNIHRVKSYISRNKYCSKYSLAQVKALCNIIIGHWLSHI